MHFPGQMAPYFNWEDSDLVISLVSLLTDFFLKKHILLCNECVITVEKFYDVNKLKNNTPQTHNIKTW